MNKYNLTKNIKEISKELGFDLVGVSKPEIHKEPSLLLEKWLDNNMHATMHWIEKRKEERKNIFKYFPNVKSIISFGHNYYSDRSNNSEFHSGLGLSISKKIVESFSGTLELIDSFSESYKGACFKLKIPLKD